MDSLPGDDIETTEKDRTEIPVLSFLEELPPSHTGSGTIALPLERLIATRMLLQAESGGGKSWLLRQILEETYDRAPQFLFDLDGEFGSLRNEFPYVLVSATPGEGDLRADPETARSLCRRLVELSASAILDLYDLNEQAQQVFTVEFLDELMYLPRTLWTDRLVLIDEADRVAPEKSAALSTPAVRSLVKRARKRRIGVVLATTRLADLDKGAAGGLQNKLIGMTTLGTDMTRSASDLGFDRKRRRELLDLAPGTFFAQGPAFPFRGVSLLRSGPVRTTHGLDPTAAPPKPPASLAHVLAALEDLSPTEVYDHDETPVNPRDFDVRVRDAADERVRRELPALLDARVRERTLSLYSRVEALQTMLSGACDHAATLLQDLETFPPHEPRPGPPPGQDSNACDPTTHEAVDAPTIPRPSNKPEQTPYDSKPPKEAKTESSGRSSGNPEESILAKSHRSILGVLELLRLEDVPPLDRRNLALLAGRSPRSSRYEAALALLKNEGLVSYPEPGTVAITRKGSHGSALSKPHGYQLEAADVTLATLHRLWGDYLGKRRADLLRTLLDAHPEALGRDDLARASRTSPRSSRYEAALAALRSIGVVDYPAPSTVRASALLFPEGLL